MHLDAQPSDLEERVPATRTNARIHEIDAIILGFGVVFRRRCHTRTDPEKTRTQTRGENSQSRGENFQSRGEKQRRENPGPRPGVIFCRNCYGDLSPTLTGLRGSVEDLGRFYSETGLDLACRKVFAAVGGIFSKSGA